MVPERKARLLEASSQARPPSSWASRQKPVMNLMDSTVSFELIATVFPSASTSLPPKDHMNGYAKEGASPSVWPSDCPIGWPAAFSFLPTARYSSQVVGNVLAPASRSHDFR